MPAPSTPTSIGSANSAASANTLTITTTVDVQAGESIIVVGMRKRTNGFLGSITDSGGNLYDMESIASTNVSGGLGVATAKAFLASGATIVLQFDGAAGTEQRKGEAFKTATSVVVDTSVKASGSSTTAWATGSTGTTSHASELVIGFAATNNAGNPTSTPGGSQTNLANVGALVVQSELVGSAGTQASSGTWSTIGTDSWIAMCVTLRDASAGTREVVGTPTLLDTFGAGAQGATSVITLTGAVPAGATAFIVIGGSAAAAGVYAVRDTDGNYWMKVRNQTSAAAVTASIFSRYYPNGLAIGKVITAFHVNSGAKTVQMAVGYMTGRATPDVVASAGGGAGTAWSTGATPATARAGEQSIAVANSTAASLNSNTTGSTPAMTEMADISGNSRNTVLTRSTASIAAATAVTAAGTWNQSVSWNCAVASFTGVLDGVPPPSPNRMSVVS